MPSTSETTNSRYGSGEAGKATPVGTRITAAPRDLTSRFGYTPLTVAAYETLEVQASGDTGKLLARLNPAAGAVRCTMHTNAPALAGEGFAPPRQAPPTHAEPSRLRPDARPGTLEFPPAWSMFSAVVPRSAAGTVAVRVLAHQLARHLTTVTRRDDGVTVGLVPVGPDILATVMASTVPSDADREAVLGLFVARPVPDHRIAEATEWERGNGTADRTIERPGTMPTAGPLTARSLTAGTCATGTLGYLVPDDATTFVVDFHSPAGDDVSWTSG